MTILRIAYGADAVVTLWFALSILTGKRHSLLNDLLLRGTAGPSTLLAKLIGSIWLAMALALVAGIVWPVLMVPVLLLQLIYKGFWLTTFVAGQRKRQTPVPWKIAAVFTLYCATYPWMIPWSKFWQLAQHSS